MWLASELMFFSGLFAAFFSLRAATTPWPPHGRHPRRHAGPGGDHPAGAVLVHHAVRGAPGHHGQQVGVPRLAGPDLLPRRSVRGAADLRLPGPPIRHRHRRLRFGLLHPDRLPLPARARRAGRHDHRRGPSVEDPALRAPDRARPSSSSPTTGTSWTWCGSPCSWPSSCSNERPPPLSAPRRLAGRTAGADRPWPSSWARSSSSPPAAARGQNDLVSTNPADILAGQQLFQAHCQSCHGYQGGGGRPVPALVSVGAAAADFYLTTGRMPLNNPGNQAAPPPALLRPASRSASWSPTSTPCR